MTAEQQRQFEEDGFFLVEDALTPGELEALIAVIDEADVKYRQERNLKPHEAFQIRTSHMDVRPPHLEGGAQHELGSPESFFPWHADAPNFGWATIEGIIPFMEMKVGYYLTDLTEHNSGAICVVRGSHRRSPWLEQNGRRVADPDRVVEVNVRPGTAMVWRTSLFHCVTPNLSKRTRKVLYYGYCHRWLRPSDYDHQPAETLAGCSPIQLQLLGELGSGSRDYMGSDPIVHPVSRFWRPKDEDIPLKAWVEAQLAV
jgi:hypothetical protein